MSLEPSAEPSQTTSPDFAVGDRVQLASQPPYFKTATPMPMLRPPDLIPVGSEGIILDRHPGEQWSIKFDREAVLLDARYLEKAGSNLET
jgi:Protein of unknown function (DUF3148)